VVLLYTDQILILIGVLSSAIFIFLLVYLFVSRKKSRLFTTILSKETEALQTISSSFTQFQTTTPSVHLGDDFTGEEATMLMDDLLDGISATTQSTQVLGTLPIKPVSDFNPDILKGQYTILGEIEGGGMSRVFLARKDNTGNDWIIKYVPTAIGELTNEAEILKSLNHISLPKIIDIFNDETGLYIVESYIEGMGLNRILKANSGGVHEFVVSDWAIQLAQVLANLHRQTPLPILHLDLKPSNVISTYDNKLVLIDFGISRWQSGVTETMGVTVSYAAPEQLKRLRGKALEITNKRFGEGGLPDERMKWKIDERTDIYSLGIILFEAAVGHIPTFDTMDRLKNCVSRELCKIIYKCLEINPTNRYQTVEDLLTDLNRQRLNAKPAMVKTLIVRKTAKFASVASIALAFFGFAMGWTIMQREINAAMFINPEILMVSLHQSSEVQINRLLPNSDDALPMNPADLVWGFTADNIAQVDGNRVIGLNIGETVIQGRYRNAEISLMVNVIEPMDGLIDISLRFQPGGFVSLFAGTSYRATRDGNLTNIDFVSPESMAVAANGAVYIADAGRLRRLYNGVAETIELSPAFIRPHLVRTHGNEVYILTSPWQDGAEYFYGIIRITEYGGEGFFLGDAMHTAVRDFYVADGMIYLIARNDGVGGTFLNIISTQNPDDFRTLIELPEGISAIAVANGRVYLADSEQGTIMYYQNGSITHLAGVAGELAFIDGNAPLFYRPTRIKYFNNALYVWDFNVLRRLSLENGAVREAITKAGVASPVYDLDDFGGGAAESIVLPFSHLADFLHFDDGILLSDPKRGVVWLVG